MFEYRTGDILRVDAEAIVNTVNCVGIMGRGIALQFKNAYPANFEAYAEACRHELVRPGYMFVFETGYLTNPRFIINFPTKRHWKGKSRIEDINSGLVALREEIINRGIKSVAIPPLGAGLGGLEWSDVRPRIEKALEGLDGVKISIFEPTGAPDPKVMARTTQAPTMNASRAALVVLMNRYVTGLMDPFVTLLEVHKLLYFMQEAGQPLRLNYKAALYGPYAENLRHLLRTLEGHLISGYADGGDAPDKQLELVPGAIEEASACLLESNETRSRFDRVATLVEGFETPFGLELLSTVHWVAVHQGASSVQDAIEKTYSWNERKRRFSKSQIELAFQTLRSKEWLTVAA